MACSKCSKKMLAMLRRLVGLLVENILRAITNPLSLLNRAKSESTSYNFVSVWDVEDHGPTSELDISNAILLVYSHGLFRDPSIEHGIVVTNCKELPRGSGGIGIVNGDFAFFVDG
jgi:hypothetical protein